MRVIPPFSVSAGTLTSSTCAEPDTGIGEAVYGSSTIYKTGDRVISTSTHRTYESQKGTAATVTTPLAAPGIVNWTNHGLAAGTPVAFTTTGTLPTGITAGTIYYVLADTVDTFKIAATVGGSAINFTGATSGTHTGTANPNKNNAPTTDDGTNWLDVGPTNKWAMFDLLRNTGTTVASPLTVVITPGQRIDSIALVGLVASTVRIKVTVSAVDVFDQTYDLSTRIVGDWYDYFFAPFTYRQALAYFALPPYTNGVITITITRSSGNVTCGGLIIGQSVYLGAALYDAQNDALNFSTIDRSFDGSAVLFQRRSVPKVVQQVRFKRDLVMRLVQIRTDLNAIPALWSSLDDTDEPYFEPLLILGIYKRMTMTMDRPDTGLLELELEEV